MSQISESCMYFHQIVIRPVTFLCDDWIYLGGFPNFVFNYYNVTSTTADEL